jgi:MerR family redox-sensitive transcriptional activator SoxR
MPEATLTIGQVAERAGLNTSAIRFYEREGVLPAPTRVSGQRRYGEDTLARLGVIDVAKRAGFSLDEVRVLLRSADAGAPAHEQLQALAARKLPDVDALITRALAMRDWLSTATHCGCEEFDACALFADAARAPDAAPFELAVHARRDSDHLPPGSPGPSVMTSAPS